MSLPDCGHCWSWGVSGAGGKLLGHGEPICATLRGGLPGGPGLAASLGGKCSRTAWLGGSLLGGDLAPLAGQPSEGGHSLGTKEGSSHGSHVRTQAPCDLYLTLGDTARPYCAITVRWGLCSALGAGKPRFLPSSCPSTIGGISELRGMRLPEGDREGPTAWCPPAVPAP